jgi:hypothetical protein
MRSTKSTMQQQRGDALDGETAVYGAERMWEGRPDARCCQRMSNRIDGQRPAAVRSFLAHRWAESIPECHPSPAPYWPLLHAPLSPAFTCTTEAAGERSQNDSRKCQTRGSFDYIHTAPACRRFPRFFGGKHAVTALQPFSRCRGWWGWQRGPQHGTVFLCFQRVGCIFRTS